MRRNKGGASATKLLAISQRTNYNNVMDEEKLFAEVKRILIDHFDVDESIITLDANLYEELDIDSIDAVDLMVHIKELTGKKIPPEQFKEVRTIRDVLNVLTEL
jgi:acyl carrier protein